MRTFVCQNSATLILVYCTATALAQTSAPARAPAHAQDTPKAVDLLALINPVEDAVEGKWVKSKTTSTRSFA